jgi:hypothetical protein
MSYAVELLAPQHAIQALQFESSENLKEQNTHPCLRCRFGRQA